MVSSQIFIRMQHSIYMMLSTCIAVTLSFCARCSVENQVEMADEMKVAQAAFQASTVQLKSGRGSGSYRTYNRMNTKSKWKIVNDASITTMFDARKYRIVLEYLSSPRGTDRRIIVYDGSGIFNSQFSTHISRVGAKGEVFGIPLNIERVREVRPSTSGFRWDVSALPRAVLNIDLVIEDSGGNGKGIEMNRTPDGDIEGTYPVGRSNVIFRCPRKYGYNVAEKEIYGSDGALRRTITSSWRQDGSVWFIESLVETLNASDGCFKWQLELTEFDANVEVSRDSFTLAALELPSGTRILDHRHGRKARAHYTRFTDDESEAELASMIDELHSLPQTRQPIQGKSNGTFRIAVMVLNVVVVMVVAVLVVRARRKRLSNLQKANT